MLRGVQTDDDFLRVDESLDPKWLDLDSVGKVFKKKIGIATEFDDDRPENRVVTVIHNGINPFVAVPVYPP